MLLSAGADPRALARLQRQDASLKPYFDTIEVKSNINKRKLAKKIDSIVDNVFDKVTAWAAQGLTAAKKGLEASARWLEGTAKQAGELATKLAHKS